MAFHKFWSSFKPTGSVTNYVGRDGDVILDADSDTIRIMDGITPGGIVFNPGSPGGLVINDLTDVDTATSAPTNGQVLKWNGTNWVPADDIDTTLTLSSASIDDLGDVDTTTTAPTTGQVLKWNGTNWVPANDVTSGGSGLDADTLDGLDSTYFLNYNNLTNKPAVPSSIDDLTDVDTATSAPTTGDTLQWNGTNWVPVAPSVPTNNVTSVTTASHTLAGDDYYVGINYAGVCTVTLGTTTNGRVIVIKDESGAASTNNIILSGTVDNDAGGATIAIDNGSLTLIYNNGWRVI